jgi:hypothetical protein
MPFRFKLNESWQLRKTNKCKKKISKKKNKKKGQIKTNYLRWAWCCIAIRNCEYLWEPIVSFTSLESDRAAEILCSIAFNANNTFAKNNNEYFGLVDSIYSIQLLFKLKRIHLKLKNRKKIKIKIQKKC